MVRLATIGYEGAAIADFLATLLAAKINIVLDVRELPLSRRKGFSKTALATALAKESIEYRHFRALGDPKAGRDAAKAGHFSEFRKIYARHLKTLGAKDALEKVSEIVASSNACLLCYEREPNHCHRSMIADELTKLGLVKVVHLGVKAGQHKNGGPKFWNRTRADTGQSAAAAK